MSRSHTCIFGRLQCRTQLPSPQVGEATAALFEVVAPTEARIVLDRLMEKELPAVALVERNHDLDHPAVTLVESDEQGFLPVSGKRGALYRIIWLTLNHPRLADMDKEVGSIVDEQMPDSLDGSILSQVAAEVGQDKGNAVRLLFQKEHGHMTAKLLEGVLRLLDIEIKLGTAVGFLLSD